MQFMPTIYNENKLLDELFVFDASNLMLNTYGQKEKIEATGDFLNKIQTVRYNISTPFSGQSVAMAYD